MDDALEDAWARNNAPWRTAARSTPIEADPLADALAMAGIGTWCIDARTGRVTWSQLTQQIHEAADAAPRSLEEALDFFPGSARDDMAAAIALGIAEGQPWDWEVPFVSARGRSLWVRISGRAVQREGVVTQLTGTFEDVTAQRELDAAMGLEAARRTAAETLLSEVLDALPNAVVAYDREERAILFNRAYGRIFDRTAPSIGVGASLEEVLRAGLAHGQYPDAGDSVAAREEWLHDQIAAHRMPGPSRLVRLPDGRWLQQRTRRFANGSFISIGTDVTRVKTMAESVLRRASEDPLTGLGNRALLQRRLSGLVARRRAEDRATACLVFFDIDHFSTINDTRGHDCGDALLRDLADRLRGLLRDGDTAARLSSDEFGLLLPGISTATEAAAFVRRLRQELERPYQIGQARLTPSFSIGLALYPTDATDGDGLFRCADTALHHAKRSGSGGVAFFEPAITAMLARRSHLATALREALDADRIEVALQPQVRLSDGVHVGFEALARWTDGTTPIPPSEFIPVAEETGMIVPLGARITGLALSAITRLRARGLNPGRVSVNVAASQLLSPGFFDFVRHQLQTHGIEPSCLEVEVTETVLLDRASDRIAHVLAELEGLGVSIALDDFGTGYASLSHLTRLPVHRLKIDRHFVRDIATGSVPNPIARTVIGLAHGLGMQTVAEGVETEAQRDYLAAHGCDLIQGYLISRPLTPDEAGDYLARL
nr:EAL domain-containing protein [uncultured Roseococcus sp.]